MNAMTRITTSVVVLVLGAMAGTDALGAQQQHHPGNRATMDAPAGNDMMRMMTACHRMMGMMGGQGMMGGENMMSAQGMMGGENMMGAQGMMAMFGPQPAMLLRQRDALELTDEQVERLEAMDEEASASAERHMAEMERLNGEIRETLGAETPDLDRIETLLEDRAEARVEMQLERARQSREARSLLTEDQRSNLRYGAQLMRGMMRGMMERMPMQGDGAGPPRPDGPGA